MPARRCPYCRAWSNFNVENAKAAPSREGEELFGLDECQHCNRYSLFKRDKAGHNSVLLYPAVDSEPDKELPDDVKIPLKEAYGSVGDKNWNACVTMARRALDEAASNLGATGTSLYGKIEDLANKQRITPDLKAWAHEGRLGGNLGAHGDQTRKWADQQDAEEILEFTTWFMRYAYVLPAQLAERKKRVSTTP